MAYTGEQGYTVTALQLPSEPDAEYAHLNIFLCIALYPIPLPPNTIPIKKKEKKNFHGKLMLFLKNVIYSKPNFPLKSSS